MKPNSDTRPDVVCAQRCMMAKSNGLDSTAAPRGRVMAKMSAQRIPTPQVASAVRDWKKTVSSCLRYLRRSTAQLVIGVHVEAV